MVGQKDLDRVVDSSNIRATLQFHSKSLYGNEGTGLVRQVDRIQISYKTVQKMLVGFSALISSFLAYLGFK